MEVVAWAKLHIPVHCLFGPRLQSDGRMEGFNMSYKLPGSVSEAIIHSYRPRKLHWIAPCGTFEENTNRLTIMTQGRTIILWGLLSTFYGTSAQQPLELARHHYFSMQKLQLYANITSQSLAASQVLRRPIMWSLLPSLSARQIGTWCMVHPFC